jgi:hypothetical protein
MELRYQRELLRQDFLLVGGIEVARSPQCPRDEENDAHADRHQEFAEVGKDTPHGVDYRG